MTNVEQLIRGSLERAADQAPPYKALPVLDKEAAPPSKHWSIPLLVGAMAAAAITAVAISAGGLRGESLQPSAASSVGVNEISGRLVGVGRVEITVPSAYSTEETRCGVAVQDTVVTSNDGGFQCLLTPRPKTTAVHLEPAASRLGQQWASEANQPETINGIDVHLGTGYGESGSIVTILAVSDLGAVFKFESWDSTEVDQMIQSLSEIPDSSSAVPSVTGITLHAARAAMADAGFETRFEGAPTDTVIDSRPPSGSIANKGTVIAITSTS